MAILNYLLVLGLAFLGLFAGLLLGYIAKEELKPGKKYLVWLQNIILIIAAVLVLYSFQLHIILFILIGILITLVLIYLQPKAVIGYIILASLILLIMEKPNFFMLTSSLTFLYGFPAGSLILIRKK
ncbi:hypothetical protein KY343_06085 [Candidatus Woesearchaeota archaeon]|nr:hypothetical protein [Candidatus Woesearchaeota archaeon]